MCTLLDKNHQNVFTAPAVVEKNVWALLLFPRLLYCCSNMTNSDLMYHVKN